MEKTEEKIGTSAGRKVDNYKGIDLKEEVKGSDDKYSRDEYLLDWDKLKELRKKDRNDLVYELLKNYLVYWNKTNLSERLGITYNHLYGVFKEMGLGTDYKKVLLEEGVKDIWDEVLSELGLDRYRKEVVMDNRGVSERGVQKEELNIEFKGVGDVWEIRDKMMELNKNLELGSDKVEYVVTMKRRG